MSYIVDGKSLAIEIVYIESAGHSNANMLRSRSQPPKKYIGITKALFASKATKLEYEFVTKVAETKFYAQQART